jgi:1,4-alpha-glucan branching enzyme
LSRFLGDLGGLYQSRPELWRGDPDLEGFRWLDADDRDRSVYGYFRRDGDGILLVLLNLTPVPRPDYRCGAPVAGRYGLVLSSDDPKYGGSGYGLEGSFDTDDVAWQGQPVSLGVSLPPLGAVLLGYQPR